MEQRIESGKTRRCAVRALTVGLALALGLSACSSGDGGDESVASELPTDISILVPFNPPAFDQWTIVGQPLGTILMVNEPVVEYNGTEFVPVLAEEFEAVTPTQYTYTIREGITFTDGTPLTAEDVKYSFETAMQDTHFSTTHVVMSSIADVQTDGNLVTVNLQAPQPQFQYIVAQTGIVSEDFYEANGDRVGTPSVGQVGTGPYVLDEFRPEEVTTIARNPDYWGEPAAFDSITFTAAGDDSARMLSLQSGDPTGIFELPIGQVSAIDGLDGYSIHEVADTTFYILQMDVTKAPFDDPNVRDAVRHAINRETIVDAAFDGNGVVASTLTSAERLSTIADPALVEEALAGFDEQNAYDPELAQELIAESTVPDGFQVELPVETDDPNMNLIGQTVVQDLATIGIDAVLTPLSDGYFERILLARDHEGLTLNSFSTNTPDPAMPMGYFTPADGLFNLTGLANEEATARFEESNSLPVADPERGELILEALSLQQESGAILPLAMPGMFFGMQTGLGLDGFTNYWWMSRWDLEVSVE